MTTRGQRWAVILAGGDGQRLSARALCLPTGPGRSLGVDAFLGPRLDQSAAGGSRLAQLVRLLT